MPGPAFLEGEQVVLRPIERDDLEFLQRQVNDPSIWRPIGRNDPVNYEQEEEFFEDVVCDEDTVNLLVSADGTPAGTISIGPLNRPSGRAELGYWIAPDQQGQGYGTAATELMLDYGFGDLALHRIEARVFSFNDASRRLLERVGFTQEGVHRETVFTDGSYHDTYWYGILADEWLE